MAVAKTMKIDLSTFSVDDLRKLRALLDDEIDRRLLASTPPRPVAKVDVQWIAPTGSGGRVGWAKTVRMIDAHATGANKFIGRFLTNGMKVSLPIGRLIVEVSPRGTAREPYQAIRLLRVTNDHRRPLQQLHEPHLWPEGAKSFVGLVTRELPTALIEQHQAMLLEPERG